MRVHRLPIVVVAALVGPLVLTGASGSPELASNGPVRCYDGVVYESISGLPNAEELVQAYLDGDRAVLADLQRRAPQVGADPYFQVNLDQARGGVEGFSALLAVARENPTPPLDQPLRALDEEGRLVAEITFSSTIDPSQGPYALDGATLPNPGRDPANGCV